MLVPSRRTVWLCVVPALASLAVLVEADAAKRVVVALDAFLVALLLLDLRTLPRRRGLEVARTGPRVVSVRHPHGFELTVTNRTQRRVTLTVNDDQPGTADVEGLPATLELPPAARATVAYHLSFRRRGEVALERVHLRATSGLGLWERVLRLECPGRISVYPDLRPLTEYRLLARRQRTHLLGIRRVSQPGGDSEFERLRAYTRDDPYRHVAWRASAKRDELVAKTFQASQNQSVVFLLDCGRMMRAAGEEAPPLDRALEAFLLAAEVALGHQDQVGMLAFSDRLDGYLPPFGGPKQLDRMIDLAHDQHPRLVTSNYEAAFAFLERRLRKRSLVLLVTRAVDDASFSALRRHLRAVRRRHLPVVALLRERAVEAIADDESRTGEDAFYERAAAAEIIAWRTRQVADLRRNGVLCLDLAPEELGTRVVNEYLRVKGTHLL